MALAHSPKIVTDSLVFAYDMGNTSKSWKGKPTTNLRTVGLTGMQGLTLSFITEEDGWKKYGISGTFSAGTYPYSMYITSYPFVGGTTYSSSCYIKTNVANKFNYFGTGMNYVNQPMNNSGTSFSTVQPDGSRYAGRRNFAYTSTTTQVGYLLTNPINNTTFNSSTDFVWIKEGQIETGEFPTPFAGDSGTRSSAQAVLDMTNIHTTTPNLTYAIDNTFSFNGSSNYIDSGLIASTGTSTQSLTWACWAKPSAVSGDIINMYSSAGWNMCPIWSTGQKFYAKVWNTTTITGPTFTLNQYYHLVLVRDYSTLTNSFYVNGSLVGTSTGAYSASGISNTVGFGRAGSQATNTYFNGSIPIGNVYTKALSASEVAQNFQAVRGRYGI